MVHSVYYNIKRNKLCFQDQDLLKKMLPMGAELMDAVNANVILNGTYNLS